MITEGFTTEPKIKKVKWEQANQISIYLVDGRIIICPVKNLPSLKKTPINRRNRAQIIDETIFTFEGCPEVYHLEQVLGNFQRYKYKTLTEQAAEI